MVSPATPPDRMRDSDVPSCLGAGRVGPWTQGLGRLLVGRWVHEAIARVFSNSRGVLASRIQRSFASHTQFLSKVDVRLLHGEIDTAEVPVLILAPTKSRNTSLEDQKRQNEAIKGSRMAGVDGSGHEIYVDKAGECQKAVSDFLGPTRN